MEGFVAVPAFPRRSLPILRASLMAYLAKRPGLREGMRVER